MLRPVESATKDSGFKGPSVNNAQYTVITVKPQTSSRVMSAGLGTGLNARQFPVRFGSPASPARGLARLALNKIIARPV
jgi:hypothetical protein